MKKFLFILTILTCISCKEARNGQKSEDTSVSKKINTEFNILETNFKDWWTYHENNISLTTDFVAINEHSEKITKGQFLKALITSEYIPTKLNLATKPNTYKLFKLSESADNSIRSTIKSTSKVIYKRFKLEGTNFPKFSFTDLNGKEYKNENTLGKRLVVKCWFINCKPCIAEFPELNQLVEDYEDREDFLFIALAIDSKEDLDKFLLKKVLKYETIPNQEGFMEKTLDVKQYPTHFVIGKSGTIEKVFSKSRELISYLKEGHLLNLKEDINPPPPPMPPPPSAE